MTTSFEQDNIITDWFAKESGIVELLRLDCSDLITNVIARHFDPTDVYPTEELHYWAVNNGYVEEA